MDNNARKTYYTSFSTHQFLGAKEILKSMPLLYNRVYFSSKYANVLYDNTSEEFFENVSLLSPKEDLNSLRQIIKTNFLYINEWDSINFTKAGDYGFSFIAGKIKFIVMPFEEVDEGYKVLSYDATVGTCFETVLKTDKSVFFNTIVNDGGEIIKTCDFNIEYMNESNTKHFIAEEKEQNIAVVESNSGFIKHNVLIIILIVFLCVCSVVLASKMIS